MAPDKQITPRNAAQQLNGTTIGKRRKLSHEERARGSEGSRPPASGRTEWLITSTVSTAGMSAALQEFASEVGAGADRRIALVIDGAGWHSAPDVVVPEGVHLIFQPPYSPDVQPSEQLWPLLHEPLANRDFVDMNEHAAVTSARCKELSAQPDVVRGRTLFHWWPEDRAPRAERAAS